MGRRRKIIVLRYTLNIAIVAPFILGGGLTVHLRETIPRFRKTGHKITLITGDTSKAVPEADLVKTYHVWAFPIENYGFMPSAILNVNRLLKESHIMHIHGYTHFLADYLTITKSLHRIPLIISFHGSFHQATTPQMYYLKKIHNKFMLKFQTHVYKFIAVSYYEKQEVIKWGIPKQKVEVIYNGVPMQYLSLRRKREGAVNTKTILFLGRLAPSKNPELLVSAMKYITNEIKDSKLILAGPDWGMQRKLEKMAVRLGIERNVKFLGKVSEKQKNELLASSDVFVYPSLQDVFSISVLEASAAELPVVAFNVGGNSEMVINGYTGILVDDLIPKALADAILRVLIDTQMAKKMGEAGRKYVSNKFSWKETVNRLETLYCEAAGLL